MFSTGASVNHYGRHPGRCRPRPLRPSRRPDADLAETAASVTLAWRVQCAFESSMRRITLRPARSPPSRNPKREVAAPLRSFRSLMFQSPACPTFLHGVEKFHIAKSVEIFHFKCDFFRASRRASPSIVCFLASHGSCRTSVASLPLADSPPGPPDDCYAAVVGTCGRDCWGSPGLWFRRSHEEPAPFNGLAHRPC